MAGIPAFDRARIIETLDRHGVEYLIVGGVGAQLHGATRPTADFDSLASTTQENLSRLAAALRELDAFCGSEVSPMTKPERCRLDSTPPC